MSNWTSLRADRNHGSLVPCSSWVAIRIILADFDWKWWICLPKGTHNGHTSVVFFSSSKLNYLLFTSHSIQIYLEQPATEILLNYADYGTHSEAKKTSSEATEAAEPSWGWAATTTTLDYDSEFSALPKESRQERKQEQNPDKTKWDEHLSKVQSFKETFKLYFIAGHNIFCTC